MRVGIMLRTLEENQGIGIYTRNVIPRILELDDTIHYVLIYRGSKGLGRFADFKNVEEIALSIPTKPLWDQVGVPWLARKHSLDLIFNAKFTVPFFTARRTVMTLHGSDWFTYPEHYGKLDVAYVRAFMPMYCRKANHMIANSDMTKRDFVRILGVPEEKITTIPLSADDSFEPVRDARRLQAVREKYHLPEKFLLSVTKYFRGKNVPALIRAHGRLPDAFRIPLVLVGGGVEQYVDDMGLRGTPDEARLVMPGWVDQRDLPAIYSLAEAFALPSRYEAFGIPVLEAMACGCPALTANMGAMPEITQGAALLVDPDSEESITGGLERLLGDSVLREDLRRRGLARAAEFSWEKHARSTLSLLRRVAS